MWLAGYVQVLAGKACNKRPVFGFAFRPFYYTIIGALKNGDRVELTLGKSDLGRLGRDVSGPLNRSA
ncbi:MAG: hypothetical protein CEE38_11890 [Planctomycetes bacterium B3_Pla]|nr:MAG: hypothetical protein CEE38_11890 [Planctomycetes bacterium B3_Pla]